MNESLMFFFVVVFVVVVGGGGKNMGLNDSAIMQLEPVYECNRKSNVLRR